jgi:tetratricopeptide (TPR) repeat protein
MEAFSVNSNRLSVAFGVLLLALLSCGIVSSKERLLETGNKYFEEGKYNEASIVYRKAIQKDPLFGEAYYRLGLDELKQGRFGEALHALRRASELQPENNDAHAKLGDLYLTIYLSDRERYKELLADLAALADSLLERDPKAFEGLRMKGLQYIAEGRFEDAIAQFEEAEVVQPVDSRTNLAWVQALAAGGRPEEAIDKAHAYLDRDPSAAPMYDFLYVQYMVAGRAGDAEEILSSKVERNPKEAVYRMELAAHYRRLNEPERMNAALDEITAHPADFPRGHELVGDFYYRIEDFETAGREYEAGVASDPDNKAGYQKRLVDLLARQGRRDAALDLARRIVRENNGDYEAKAILASLRMRGGSREDLDQSIEELQSLISRMPDNPVVRFNLGEALAARGDADRARVQLEEAIKLRPVYLPPRLSLARLHMARRDYPMARQLADEIIALAGEDVPARLVRTAALLGLNDVGGARQEIARVQELSPGNPDALYLRSMIDFNERRYAEAEKTFRQLHQMNPPDLRGLLGLAEVAMAAGRPAEARVMLEKELSSGRDSREIRLALANVFVRSGDYQAAARAYQRLLDEEPESADLHLKIGDAHLRSKSYAQALTHLSKARELSPRGTAPLLKIASLYELTGRRNQLRPTYEAVLKIEPDNAIALNNLAYLLADGGLELDRALTYAQRAKRQMPNNPDVDDTLGWVYIKKNLSDDAIRIFENLLEQKPNHVTWRYRLATALAQKGDKQRAKKEIGTAMANNPTAAERRQMRELLDRIG